MIDNWWLLVFLPFFWWYFLAMDVRVTYDGANSWLPNNKLTFGVLVRSGFALSLSYVIAKDLAFSNNLLSLSFIIGLLIGPLGMPSVPGDAKTYNVISFLSQWLFRNVDVFLKTSTAFLIIFTLNRFNK